MTSSSEQTTTLIAEAREVADLWRSQATGTSEETDLFRRLADALEAATKGADTMFTSEYVDALRAEVAPRVVSTVAELDALPDDSVIRSADGVTLEKSAVAYSQPGWDESISRDEIERGYAKFPYTVLWVGGTE